jgi:hypothetical protein
MKPLNTQERKKPFLRFLLFYIITTLLLVVVLLFGLQVPFRQNDLLQERINQSEKQQAFYDNFFVKLKQVSTELDSVNTPGVPVEFLEGQIDQKLSQLTKIVAESDSSINKKALQDIVKSYYDIKDDKRTIRNSSSKDAVVQQYMQDNATLKQSLKEWQDAYNALKLQMMATQR